MAIAFTKNETAFIKLETIRIVEKLKQKTLLQSADLKPKGGLELAVVL